MCHPGVGTERLRFEDNLDEYLAETSERLPEPAADSRKVRHGSCVSHLGCQPGRAAKPSLTPVPGDNHIVPPRFAPGYSSHHSRVTRPITRPRNLGQTLHMINLPFEAVAASLKERAAALGKEHCVNACAWWQQETLGGRVTNTDTAARASAYLERLDNGDPEFMDSLPYPDFSGQWADSYTIKRLLEDLDLDEEDVHDTSWLADDLHDAYQDAWVITLEETISQHCVDAGGVLHSEEVV